MVKGGDGCERASWHEVILTADISGRQHRFLVLLNMKHKCAIWWSWVVNMEDKCDFWLSQMVNI